jgi:TonB-linked SusC/RagA family outer membrane protein
MKKKEIIKWMTFSYGYPKQILRIMKLSLLLLSATLINVFGGVTYSQTAKLSIDMNDVPMLAVLENIEDQSEFFFLYSSRMINVNQKVTLSCTDKKIDDVLNNLFEKTDIKYFIKDRQILLVDKESYINESNFMEYQQAVISGTITDESTGQPMPGVNILVKGTTNGAISDSEGKFSLNVPDLNATLSLTFIGYISQEIQLTGRKTLDIKMTPSLESLDEVVVVGFGTQKKVNLTGSVAAVASKDIEKLSVTSTSQLLSGLVSGVTAIQSSGQPGRDNASITVRGLGTFSGAGNSPLVLVDGLASSLDAVNINDIASISVLKDAASASIYGTRAANGVILVETKKGKEGVMNVTYQGSVGFQRATATPEFVDSWVFAEMYNEALINGGGSPQYSVDEIAKFKSGEDPDYYPNSKHYYDLVHSGSGFQTDHHLSFTGGSAKNSYLFSFGYLKQDGLVARTDYQRYNLLLNVDSKLRDNLVLNLKFSGKYGLQNEPTAVDKNPSTGLNGILNYAAKIPNAYAGKMSNGYYGNQTGFTIEGWMDSNSFIKNDDINTIASATMDWNILKNLRLTGKAGYDFSTLDYKMWRPVLIIDQFITRSPSDLTQRNTKNALLTLQAFANYDFKLGSNSFHLLGGYSQESNRNNYIQAFRDNFPNNLLFEINAGAASNQQNSGSASEWALRSFFGRFNYDYKEKYLLEADARYDGSSRFADGKKYGLFPSLSVGYRVSKEDFFNVPLINDLKLRASIGKLGNQNIGNYPYQQLLSLGLNVPFGTAETLSSGAAAQVVPNYDISWEQTRVADAGIDISMFKSKLNFSFDYFDKLTTGILYNITASEVLGLTPSVQNAGTVSNKGVDLNILYQDNIGEVSYSIGGNFSYDKNEVVELANVKRDIANGLFVGSPLRSIYGYRADGLFVDQEDITGSPKQPLTPKPGDIKFMDLSGPNGVPDGKVDADYDRTIIGNEFPKYNFGANLTVRYKGFDLGVQLSGVAGFSHMLSGYAGNANYQGSNIQQWMVDERWTAENPNPNAKYPRLLVLGGNEPQFWNSTYILQDASYLRLNNAQLGYILPESIVRKLSMSSIKFYVGVTNLLTFSHFRTGWDPETVSNYPPTQYYNVGLNVNF